ncbi:MAG: helix-turn-helix transcriptional regulator [Alphaproteobacteria bacterium]|nr:helix-turn-helix transcriptional regulator [Alphaproteobacteria bacterium]
MTIIGNNIRRLRKEKGLRQIDLAIAVGIDSSYLSEIENKKRNPTILLLDNIATVLEVSLVELLSDNQHKD